MTRTAASVTASCFIAIFVASCASHEGAPRTHFLTSEPATTTATQAGAAEGGLSLTVYSTADPATFSPQDLLQDQLNALNNQYGPAQVFAPGYGVVRQTRRLNLNAGTNRVEFTDVAAGIDPTTVTFRSITAPDATRVLEQNFEYDLASADKLLQKYLGRQVVISPKRSAGDAGQPVRGTLLSSLGGSYVIQTDDPATPLMILKSDSVETVRLADAHTGFVSKPTLNWNVAADRAGPQDVQVAYQTDGLTWRADYALLLSQDEKTADLSAWVTLLNSSGIAYPQARLKLVAGNVQRFESPERQQQRVQVANSLFANQGQEEAGFKEKGFFEYHLYTLGRPATLPNNSTKQIELFEPKSAVPVEKRFVYYGLSPRERYSVLPSPQSDRAYGTESNTTVDIYVRFKNGKESGLGVPLPAGRVRVYKTDPDDASREFIGEDVIQHTPRDEPVMVRLGTAFDLVGERKQLDYREEANTASESFEITLRNHKPQPVHVIVKENLYRWFNWQITAASEKWEKKDFRTIHFPLEVPAGGEKKLTYTVKYTW